MEFEISDDDVVKIASIVDNKDIKNRAAYLIERDEFVETFPGEHAEEIFDLIRHGLHKGILYKEVVSPEIHDELARVLATHDYRFEWPDEIVPCPFERDALMQCYRCEEYAWESEMATIIGKKIELQCPSCNAISKPLGRRHKRHEKFKIIDKE